MHRGTATTYGYSVDPVNALDLSGRGIEDIANVTPAEAWIIARQLYLGLLAYVYWKAGLYGKRIGTMFKDGLGMGNAARHLVWQLTIGSIWGRAVASDLATAHEGDSYGADHEADLINNHLAQALLRSGAMPSISMWSVAWGGVFRVNWALSQAKRLFWISLKAGALSCVYKTVSGNYRYRTC